MIGSCLTRPSTTPTTLAEYLARHPSAALPCLCGEGYPLGHAMGCPKQEQTPVRAGSHQEKECLAILLGEPRPCVP